MTYKFVSDNLKIYQALENVPQTVQNCIDDINMYECGLIMRCCTLIPPVANTLDMIYIFGPLWDEFIYEYYNENNDYFGLLFQKYTSSAVDSIYHKSTVI